MNEHRPAAITRRRFVRNTSALALGALGARVYGQERASAVPNNLDRHDREIRVGVIGCGGRGTGAAENALDANPRTRIVALADLFEDQLEKSRGHLASLGERAIIEPSRCHHGFDAYERLLESDVDVVVLATPPHFRPLHFEAAIRAGKHVFLEKPVASDAVGVRRVVAAAAEADDRRLSVVAGTQRRQERCYLEAIERLHRGDAGRILAGRVYWNMGSLWMKPPQPEWSEMEWQIRNWLYFTWLSGDHYVEQHVHNLDVANWAFKAHPVKAMGVGGRQVRTEANFGNVFDHFAVEYEYPNGEYLVSMARQIENCANRVDEVFLGSEGTFHLRPGAATMKTFTGETSWRFAGDNGNPYVDELVALFNAIERGEHVNQAPQVAESTLTAIMGRMAAYTGQEVTWEQAMNSKEDLSPPAYAFAPNPVAAVAMPGRTPLR